MAWFRNHYECYRCNYYWEDEWSSQVDDDCPCCGARHASSFESEDLTFLIEEEDHCFVVLKSSAEAGDEPEYVEAIRFLSRSLAEAYIRSEPSCGLI